MNKKIAIAFVFFTILLNAQEKSRSEEINPNRFYFGPEFICYNLKTSVGNINVKGTRFFWGFRVGYEYQKPNAFYAGIDLMGTSASVDFQAHSDSYFSWHRADRGFGNLEAKFGYTFAPSQWMISSFLGLGMYNIYAVDHHNKQGFEQNLPYAAAGIHSLYMFSQQFNLGVDLKLLHTFAADKKFKFSNGKNKSHENFWGGEVGIPILWHLGSSLRWDIQLEPYFLKLTFGETQNIYGLRLLFGYKF